MKCRPCDILMVVLLLAVAVMAAPTAVSAQSRPAPVSQNLPPGDWLVLNADGYLIYHEAADQLSANELLALYQKFADDFCAKLGVERPQGIRVFIAPNEGRFRLLTRGLPHWTGGLAYPAQRLMILQSPRMLPSFGQFSVTALHELVHVLMGEPTQSHYPRWFSEGVAMYLSGETMYKNRAPLGRAVVFGKTYTLDGIDDVMRLGPEQARVAYLESISFVQFLVDNYGWNAIAALLHGYQENRNPDAVITQLTGREFYDVEVAFHQFLRDKYRWFNLMAWLNFDTLLWTAASLLVMFVGGAAIIRRRRELHSDMSYIDESRADPRLSEGDPLWDEDEPPPGEWYVDQDYWR